MSRDEKGHTRAKQRRATSNRSSTANRSQLGAFWGAEQRQPESTTEAAADDVQGHEHATGRGGGREPHGTHRRHTATLGSLDNVNGGRLYPTFLPFMHLGGKHSSIDSKPWPLIGVGFGVPYFLGIFPPFFICALKTQYQKTRPKSEGQIQALGRILRGCGTEPQNGKFFHFLCLSWKLGSLKNRRRLDAESSRPVGRALDPESGRPESASGLCHFGCLDCGRATPPAWPSPVPPHRVHRNRTLTLKRGIPSLDSWEGEPSLPCQGADGTRDKGASSSLPSPNSERSQWWGKQGGIHASKEQSLS